jgi:hypothetical protein
MSEAAGRREGGRVALEVPSGQLPPVEYRDLPEPLPLGRIIGPGVLLAASAVGSGEFVLWPYIAAIAGLVGMWAAVVGVITQYFINMEVERYALATGESAVTGFTRLWKPWGTIILVMAIIPLVWPGLAAGAATTLTFALGGGNVALITVLQLLAIGIALTVSPVVYQAVEKIQLVMIALILAFLAAAVALGTEARAWGDLVTGLSGFGRVPEGVAPALFLSALAFAGSGGAGNLVLSNWIREKGLAMGSYIPKVVSPITGQEEAVPSLGYTFETTEENMRRWRGWWRVANREQLITFVLITIIGIVVLSVLSYSTVFGQEVGEDLSFIQNEGRALKDAVAPWFGTLFWLGGTVILFSTNLGNLDIVGRITSDVLKTSYLRESTFWSESKIYFAIVWTYILTGVAILFAGLEQPLILIILAGALTGLVMFVYSVLLIVLNRRALPDAIKVRGLRLVMMCWAVLLFGFFSVITIMDQF